MIALAEPTMLRSHMVFAGGITEPALVKVVARALGKVVISHCPTSGIAPVASP